MQTGEESQAAAPQQQAVMPTGTGQVETWTPPPSWSRSITLRREDIELNRLPAICAATGEPTTDRLRRRWTTAPKWAGYLFLLGVLPSLVAYFVTRRSVVGYVPVAANRARRFRAGQTAGVVFLVAWLATWIMAALRPDAAGNPSSVLLLAGFVALAAVVGAAVFSQRALGFKYTVLDDRSMELTDANPAFVAAAAALHPGEPTPLVPPRPVGLWRVLAIAVSIIATLLVAGFAYTSRPVASPLAPARADTATGNVPGVPSYVPISDTGHFTASFAGTPAKTTGQATPAPGVTLNTTTWEVVTSETDEFVSYVQASRGFAPAALDQAIDGSAQGTQSTVLGRTKTTFQGMPAMTAVLHTSTGAYMEDLCVLDGRTMFLVGVGGTSNPPADYERFVSSFKILAP